MLPSWSDGLFALYDPVLYQKPCRVLFGSRLPASIHIITMCYVSFD